MAAEPKEIVYAFIDAKGQVIQQKLLVFKNSPPTSPKAGAPVKVISGEELWKRIQADKAKNSQEAVDEITLGVSKIGSS